MDFLEGARIRSLRKEDLETIVSIDEQLLGENRRDYWERKLESINSSYPCEMERLGLAPILSPDGVYAWGYDQFRVKDLMAS